MMPSLKYTGKGLLKPVIIKRADGEEELFPYIADPELIKAVNLAIMLRRPLLLMGEPGCGKSILAKAVAYELHHRLDAQKNIVRDYEDYYFEWNIKSTSKAKDGLYEYDAIQRLADAQILTEGQRANLDKSTYVKRRAMGLAFEKSTEAALRPVLLIDEIDKADMDFPNDLLIELDKGKFTITETGKTVKAAIKPIVFITSNGEKSLPDAFLRRCLFHTIKPLDETILTNIIECRFYDGVAPNLKLIKASVGQFLKIRRELKRKKLSVGKNVSTSELLDWFEAIKFYKEIQEKYDLAALDDDVQALIQELDKLGKDTRAIPFQQVLFKDWSTLVNFQESEDE